jgi:hypothetical protein
MAGVASHIIERIVENEYRLVNSGGGKKSRESGSDRRVP